MVGQTNSQQMVSVDNDNITNLVLKVTYNMEKSALTLIIDLLKVDDFYNESENIDIAKGVNKLPRNFKDMKNIIKRKTSRYVN